MAALSAPGCNRVPSTQDDESTAPNPWPSVDATELAAKFLSGIGYVGESLILNADNTFEYTSSSCMITKRSAGTYQIDAGAIVLHADGRYPRKPEIWSRGRQLKPVQWKSMRLLPVSWDDRMYLVDENRIVLFCNQVNEAREPRTSLRGEFFLREGDEDKTVTKAPTLSREYAEYLLPTPFEATVVSRKEHVLTLDKGQEDGLRVGMMLTTPRPAGESHATGMEVASVDQKTAVAEIRWGRWLEPGEKAYIRDWKLNERPSPEYP